MTPLQKLRWMVLISAYRYDRRPVPEITAANIDALYDELVANDLHWDAVEEIRCSGEETGLPVPSNWQMDRHYESESVAAKMPDGSWVGWTNYHSGGKHSSPGAYPWMETAYDLTMTEVPVTVMKRTFTQLEVPGEASKDAAA